MTERYWSSPAKINHFLHITGRRADGYHEIQSVFQTLDFGDSLAFLPRSDSDIRLEVIDETPFQQTNTMIGELENNLCYRAAKLLQAETSRAKGVDIRLIKRTPIGGGLGGGSSNAATTLLVLNQLWESAIEPARLQALSVSLGADVSFFMQPYPAWVEGIGDQLVAMPALFEMPLLLIMPNYSVPTAEVFADPMLRRDKPYKFYTDEYTRQQMFLAYLMGQNPVFENVMTEVVLHKHPQLTKILGKWLRQSEVRMSGSGSTFFMPDTALSDSFDERICTVKTTAKAISPLFEQLFEQYPKMPILGAPSSI